MLLRAILNFILLRNTTKIDLLLHPIFIGEVAPVVNICMRTKLEYEKYVAKLRFICNMTHVTCQLQQHFSMLGICEPLEMCHVDLNPHQARYFNWTKTPFIKNEILKNVTTTELRSALEEQNRANKHQSDMKTHYHNTYIQIHRHILYLLFIAFCDP